MRKPFSYPRYKPVFSARFVIIVPHESSMNGISRMLHTTDHLTEDRAFPVEKGNRFLCWGLHMQHTPLPTSSSPHDEQHFHQNSHRGTDPRNRAPGGGADKGIGRGFRHMRADGSLGLRNFGRTHGETLGKHEFNFKCTTDLDYGG